jgi:hypothetical protein
MVEVSGLKFEVGCLVKLTVGVIEKLLKIDLKHSKFILVVPVTFFRVLKFPAVAWTFLTRPQLSQTKRSGI